LSESNETLNEIRRNSKGKTLLVGRRIGQEKLDILGAILRIEVKPGKYPTGGAVLRWEPGILENFYMGDFDSVILHRFLYKPVKAYIEDPVRVLGEVKRILRREGRLLVNSYLSDGVTKNYQSVDSFFTETEMQSMLREQGYRNVSRLDTGDSCIFVCEK